MNAEELQRALDEDAEEARGGVVVAGLSLLAVIAVALFLMGLVTGWVTA